MPGPQCRYAVGSILSEGEDEADEELLKSYETSGFNVFSFLKSPSGHDLVPPQDGLLCPPGNKKSLPTVTPPHQDVVLQVGNLDGVDTSTSSSPRRRPSASPSGPERIQTHREHEEVLERRGGCVHTEIYREGQIQFMAPSARQGDFYVPEVGPAEWSLSEQEESLSDSEVSVKDRLSLRTHVESDA